MRLLRSVSGIEFVELLQSDECCGLRAVLDTGAEIVCAADNSCLMHIGGALVVPTGPGLGVEVDEARVCEAARAGHRWRSPVWRHGDGTPAEW